MREFRSLPNFTDTDRGRFGHGKYVLAYKGRGIGQTEAEQQEAMTQRINSGGSIEIYEAMPIG